MGIYAYRVPSKGRRKSLNRGYVRLARYWFKWSMTWDNRLEATFTDLAVKYRDTEILFVHAFRDGEPVMKRTGIVFYDDEVIGERVGTLRIKGTRIYVE